MNVRLQLSWQSLTSLVFLVLQCLSILLLTCTVSRTAATHIMTESFAQYLLTTGRLVGRDRGSLDSGQSQLFRFDQQPPLLLVLRTHKGDADIYITGRGRRPTTDDYDLKSENFSLDLVFVPEELKQPISALVYASPQSSENSTYTLELYRHDTLLDEYSRIRELVDTHSNGRADEYGDFWAASFDNSQSNSIYSSSQSAHSAEGGDSDTLGSLLYQLLVRFGRLLLFILEIAADA